MQNTKLLQILRLLDTSERLALRRYAKGIAAVRTTLAPKLLEIILPLLNDSDAENRLDKKAIFTKLYDKKTVYDDNLLRRYTHELITLTEDFIAKNSLEQQKGLKKRLLTQFYAKRGQLDLAQQHFDTLQTQDNSEALRDIQYYYEQLTQQELGLDLQQMQQRNEYDLQAMNDTLNTVLVAGKLRHHCKTYLTGKIYNNDFSEDLMRDILIFVEKSPQIYEIPIIGIYYHIYKMLSEENLDDFDKFRHLLLQYQNLFTQKEISDFYALAENLHIILISKNKSSYAKLLNLYEEGFEKGFIYGSDGNISIFRLQNAITAALRSDADVWALSFLEQNKERLPENIKNDVYHSNLANIYFYKKDFIQVKQLLAEVQYKDIIYQIAARRLQIKLYSEENKPRALNTAINSFERYLMTTKKKIGTDSRTMNLAFVRALRRITELAFLEKRSRNAALAKLRTEIQSEKLIAERPWLLSVM